MKQKPQFVSFLNLKLLENILINADDDENINKPGCSYETGSTGQKRKGENKKKQR